MWASVQRVWRGEREVVAGVDPWSVVDEAWAAMAARQFRCEGPFPIFACRVARNKAVDALRRAEVRRLGPSLDAPRTDQEGNPITSLPTEASRASAENEYLDAQRLVEIADAIHYSLNTLERMVFFGVRVDRKSGAAVGRELNPPLTGQRVGQILAGAMVKIHACLSNLDDGRYTRLLNEQNYTQGKA